MNTAYEMQNWMATAIRGVIPQFPRRRERVGPRVTNLAALSGRRVLTLLDGENISVSLRKKGRDCDYGKLLHAMRQHAQSVSAHAFAWVDPGEAEAYARHYFRSAGWQEHIHPTRWVVGHDGIRRRANCDNTLLLWAGALISRSPADVVVICSGDGDLVEDVIDFMGAQPAKRKPVVLGVAGSISGRLRPGGNTSIHAMIEIGDDVTVPV